MNCLDVEHLTISLRDKDRAIARRQGCTAETGIGGRVLVHEVSFSIGTHETLAVIGSSGSGKTLTALSIMGLLDPAVFSVQGKCSFFGTDLLPLPEKERKRYCLESIAMIYQNPFRSFSPVETIQTHLRTLYRLKRKVPDGGLLYSLFTAVGLNMEDMLPKYPHECSGGELQRIMIVCSLLFKPQLLICDEPSSALDFRTGMALISLLNTLKEQTGMSMLFITHDISLIKDSADKIVIMKDGGIVEAGAATAVFSSPQHPYTRLLIEAAYLEKPC